MKNNIRVYAGTACALAFLTVGCVPVAGVNNSYGVSGYNSGYYYSNPTYRTSSYGLYGIGYPNYTNANVRYVSTTPGYTYNYPYDRTYYANRSSYGTPVYYSSRTTTNNWGGRFHN